YFVLFREMQAVKIGMADNIAGRLSELQVACPGDLELPGTAQGQRAEEKGFHEKFAHLRISGEWFYAAPDLLQAIMMINRVAADPLLGELNSAWPGLSEDQKRAIVCMVKAATHNMKPIPRYGRREICMRYGLSIREFNRLRARGEISHPTSMNGLA